MKRTGFKKKRRDNTIRNQKRRKLEEEYGIKISYWRYEGRKGVYWNLVSKYVRIRDFHKFGTCISCGKPFRKWEESQAGHYAPAQNCGFGLLFDLDNIHGECPSCNNPVFSSGKLIPYRSNLVNRYGERWVKKLDKKYEDRHKETTKEWTQKEYDKEIKKLQKKIKKLENEDSRDIR